VTAKISEKEVLFQNISVLAEYRQSLKSEMDELKEAAEEDFSGDDFVKLFSSSVRLRPNENEASFIKLTAVIYQFS
jgi:hypothetical protein